MTRVRLQILLEQGTEGRASAIVRYARKVPHKEIGQDLFMLQSLGRETVAREGNDSAGRKAGARAAELLGKHGAEVFVIEPPAELPEGGDIVDAIALGWGREQIERMGPTMPRRRKAARIYGGDDKTEPRDRSKALPWWIARFRREIKAGRLPLRVPRGRCLCLIAAMEALRKEKPPQNAKETKTSARVPPTSGLIGGETTEIDEVGFYAR